MERQEIMADKFLDNSWGTWDTADGGEAPAEHRVSAPYIIQVTNTNITSAVTLPGVGNSYNDRTATNFNQNASIQITSTITGVTYIEWLAQTESQPVKIGRTMVVSTSQSQLLQTVQIKHRDANGDKAYFVISPITDPYQQQTDRVIDDTEYVFDGYTSAIFNQINANTTATLYLFPINKFSATQTIAGRPGIENYKAPHIIKVTNVDVPRPRNIPQR